MTPSSLLLRRAVLLQSFRRRPRFSASSATKCFSTAPPPPTSAATASNTSPPPPIPIVRHLPLKHSQKRLPAVCTDPVELQELTASILQASDGSLFQYDSSSSNNSKDNKSSSQAAAAAAWLAADAVTQKVEYLVRGHAHTVPGTQWNRWITATNNNNNSSVDPDVALQTMQALLDRLRGEGESYMVVRNMRMEELHGPKRPVVEAVAVVDQQEERGSLERFLDGETATATPDTTQYVTTETFENVHALQKDIDKFAATQEASDDNDENEEEMFVVDHGQNHDAATTTDTDSPQRPSYMNDFSSPGASVAMYDALLDSMACHAVSDFVHPTNAFNILREITLRHEADGGDAANVNVHTRPTAISYNAAIRIAAACPFDEATSSNNNNNNDLLRDDALTLAFGTFDAMYQSTIPRNSATYHYLLLAVSKYFPTSRTKGNVAHGMFHHAAEQGLIDPAVLQAFQQVNTPSNGPEFDEWMQENINGKVLTSLPHEWRRSNRSTRHHPREAVY